MTSDAGHSPVTLREYMESALRSLRELFDERDRRYEERDAANKAAVRAALDASKQAAEKTESALAEYKVTANEWRGTLKDFTATAASRAETQRQFDEVKSQIADLRESRSALGGGMAAHEAAKIARRWTIANMVTVVLGLAGIAIAIISVL